MTRPRNVPRSSVQIQQLLWSRRTVISLPLPCVSMAPPTALQLVSLRANLPCQMHPYPYADRAELGVEVEREIINLIRQFGEINKKTTYPFLITIRWGLVLGWMF